MPTQDEFGNIPGSVKVLMTFINRIGFPILAFLMMFYVCYSSIKQMTATLEQMNVRLGSISQSIDDLDVSRRRH